jgi:excisionase family DNA binding protein
MPVREWLTETEAQQLLQKSRATLRRFVSSGTIQTKLERVPDSRQKQTLFHAGDVERLAQTPEPTAALVKQPRASLPTAPHLQLAAPAAKLFLTLAEAHSYSGLHKSLLVRLVNSGHLRRVPGTRHWLIARSALDAFAESFRDLSQPSQDVS